MAWLGPSTMEARLERRLKARVFRERRGVKGQSRKRELPEKNISVFVLWKMTLQRC